VSTQIRKAAFVEFGHDSLLVPMEKPVILERSILNQKVSRWNERTSKLYFYLRRKVIDLAGFGRALLTGFHKFFL
jgi:hypothetical protein